MKKYLTIFLLCIVIFVECKSYYVNPTQVNNTFCTIDEPCKTIANALLYANSGDTIVLLAGTYNGRGNRNLQVNDLSLNIQADKGYGSVIIDDMGSISNDSFILFNNTMANTTITINIEGLIFQNWKESILRFDNRGKSDVTINNSLFWKNTAVNGAAINANATNFFLTNSNFNQMYSSNDGGAAKINIGSLSMSNCSFILNRARVGGALSLSSAASLVDSKFLNNTATYGGAIAASANSLSIVNNTFKFNCGFAEGGALYSFSASFIVRNSIGFGNNAEIGGFFLGRTPGSSLYLTTSTISYNNAGNGGAMYSGFNTYIQIADCDIVHNSASNNGGFLASLSQSTTVVTSSKILNNNAYLGGGIYLIYSAKFTINQGVISNNSASNNGGGFFCADSAIFISSTTTIENNKAANNGSDLYCSPYPNWTKCEVNSNNTKIAECPDHPPDPKTPFFTPTIIIIMASFGGASLLVLLMGITYICYKRRKSAFDYIPSNSLLNEDISEIN
eukprot:TRINITY_DN17377_c0_g1_i1.p1 TRINITY_DN17377_c0_g1~~TRINITY_DN17377_c0_g1_i1.p1  ORF type:complete len:506 (+),score=150.23 TRINITY_DN17377_c0_g1_i1:1-1518(+)